MEFSSPDILFHFARPIERMLPWWSEPLSLGQWGDFWLRLFFSDPFLVCFFLPLIPVLWLFPRRHLRAGIILTGLLFLGYVFGALYPLYWLLICFIFWRLSERFVVESQRTDVIRWGPPLAAVISIAAVYLGSMALGNGSFGPRQDDWLFAHAPWLYPVYARAELWVGMFPKRPQLPFAMFRWAVQFNGIVIFTIRMMHYFSELRRKSIPAEQRTFLNFLAFCSFAPLLVQGPIERFRDFQDQVARAHEQRTPRELAYGLYRVVLGVLKHGTALFIIAPLALIALVQSLPAVSQQAGWGEFGLLTAMLHPERLPPITIDPHVLAEYFTHPERIDSWLVLFFAPHVAFVLIYLNFAAYCDIGIGFARLLGYHPIENFNKPWLARSLTDMWRRWHISFSFILRDYIYLPLIRKRCNNLFALLITFVLCGALHNLSSGYCLWGVVMGLMVAVNQRWARWMREIDRRKAGLQFSVRRAWLRLQPLPKLCAWFLTLNAFSLSALVAFGFYYSALVLWEVVRRPFGLTPLDQLLGALGWF